MFILAIVRAKSQVNMILFYSDSCPHCKNVEAYINENGISDKIKFDQKEVSQNQANATLMERKANDCGLDTTQGLGVPFFFNGQECLMGDEPIINYFKTLK
jgi:glutaredoxin